MLPAALVLVAFFVGGGYVMNRAAKRFAEKREAEGLWDENGPKEPTTVVVDETVLRRGGFAFETFNEVHEPGGLIGGDESADEPRAPDHRIEP